MLKTIAIVSYDDCDCDTGKRYHNRPSSLILSIKFCVKLSELKRIFVFINGCTRGYENCMVVIKFAAQMMMVCCGAYLVK